MYEFLRINAREREIHARGPFLLMRVVFTGAYHVRVFFFSAR